MRSEAALQADFRSLLRYAQCWEDADILVGALEVRPGHTCLSVASAGENTLSLLAGGPARMIAVDLNPAQLAALELRVAAFRELSHPDVLALIGSRPHGDRGALYARCRGQLSRDAREFWDARPDDVRSGIGTGGKFEKYFALFRRRVLPLVHRKSTIRALLEPRDRSSRQRFYDEQWNSLAWRLMFRAFFSELVLGRLGRDPAFFRYAESSVADHLLARVRHALVELDPADNPYLEWILTGTHAQALPHALREKQYDAIRANLDRLEWHCAPIEDVAAVLDGAKLDRANLSNIFEYVTAQHTRALLDQITGACAEGARLAYWNMIVARRGADYLPHRLRPLTELSRTLFARDKAFFYRDFIVEEVAC